MNRKYIIPVLSMVVLVLASLACWRTSRPNLVFAPDKLPDAQVGGAYEVEVRVTQNETPVYMMLVQDGVLPNGLKLEYVEHDSFAKITGTPEKAGTYKFTIYAGCLGTNVNGQTGEMEYTIVVK